METTKTYTFFFDADHEEMGDSFYGYACLKVFFSALLRTDAQQKTVSRILVGDAILYSYAGQISEVSGNRTFMVSHDRTRFSSIIQRTTEALENGWHTFSNSIALKLASSNILLICIPSLPEPYAPPIDSLLKDFPPYLGAAEVDLSDPLLKGIMIDQLLCYSYVDRQKLKAKEDTQSYMAMKEIAKQHPNYEFNVIEDEDWENLPPLPEVEEISASALVSQEELQRDWKDHRHKIAETLYQSRQFDTHFKVDLPEATAPISIDPRKLKDYALNAEHLDGGADKAKVFQAKLGITREYWEFLYLQIIEKMKYADIQSTSVTEHGIKYSTYLKIEGINGNKLGVLAAWIVKSGEAARLTSIYLLERREQAESEDDGFLLYAPENLPLEERWSAIFEIASLYAQKAFDAVIPRAIVVGEENVIWDGICGYGTVKVSDARTKLGRWIVRSGYGYPRYPGVSIAIRTDSQSYDRNCAYAEAFGYVLKLNGIDCQVGSWID